MGHLFTAPTASSFRSIAVATCLFGASVAQAANIVSVTSTAPKGNVNQLMTTWEPGPYIFGIWNDFNYVGSNIPDPAYSTVTFKFDSAVVLTGLTVIQHENGVTLLENMGGESLNSLASNGQSLGTLGDIVGYSAIPNGYVDHFTFGPGAPGIFQTITVLKTNAPIAFASYRWYPEFAAVVPEPSRFGLLLVGAVSLLTVRRSRR